MICGPPPCTTTGLSPTYRRKTTSSAKARCSAGSVIACPPYLSTTTAPWKRASQGSASTSVAALASAAERSGEVVDGHVEYAEFSWT